jgi:hypothetical protein
MRRRRPASVSTIPNVGTGGKSRLVLICARKCVLREDYAIKSAEWSTPLRLLHKAVMSFIVDVEVLLS